MTDEGSTQPTLRVLRLPEVQNRLGNISRSLLFRWVKNGEFPAPSKIGPNKNIAVWPESVVTDWLNGQLTK